MDRRKELKEQYKLRKIVGAVYRIVNKENGRFYLRSTDDIKATRNLIGGWNIFGSCSLPPIQEDWKKFGSEAFYLEELDLLEKTELQTTAEFRSDLHTLLEMWSEKLPQENRY